ncbi:hypothetical protein KAI92_01120 [Candidatus Parcubacteria bacterium]|nr:hypothetical protein [Candidatus Parcubacteria bacterium]
MENLFLEIIGFCGVCIYLVSNLIDTGKTEDFRKTLLEKSDKQNKLLKKILEK